MSHKYKLLYQLERRPDGVAKDDVPSGYGACDAMLFASIIYPEDGSLSILFVGEDGRTNDELADLEWFKVWSLLTKRLAESRTLTTPKLELLGIVWDCIVAAMRRAGGV